jgi:hypothetical protein
MEAPDGKKLNAVAFGGYHQAAPCRTYDREADDWVEGEVMYARDTPFSGACLDRMEAARLRVPDDIFIARGNTAAAIWDEELLACHNRIQGGAGALNDLTAARPKSIRQWLAWSGHAC